MLGRRFRPAEFRIRNYDHIEHNLVLNTLTDIKSPKDSHSVLKLNYCEYENHSVRLHRFKEVEVYWNGELIWQQTQ